MTDRLRAYRYVALAVPEVHPDSGALAAQQGAGHHQTQGQPRAARRRSGQAELEPIDAVVRH